MTEFNYTIESLEPTAHVMQLAERLRGSGNADAAMVAGELIDQAAVNTAFRDGFSRSQKEQGNFDFGPFFDSTDTKDAVMEAATRLVFSGDPERKMVGRVYLDMVDGVRRSRRSFLEAAKNLPKPR